MSETDDTMVEAAAALAEYEKNLIFGDPEENHARLAAAVRAIVAVRSEPSDAQVEAAAKAFAAYQGFRYPGTLKDTWDGMARAALRAAGSLR